MKMMTRLIILTLILIMAPYRVSIKARVFNPIYRPYLDCQIPTQIYYGGSSSGKSVFIAQRTVLDMCKTDRNFLVVRKVAKSIRSSFFAEIRKAISFFKLDSEFTINKTDMEITGPRGTTIYFRGLDDVEKIKSITVVKGVVTDTIIEEATETAEADYNQLQLRMRGKTKYVKRTTLIFNPIYRIHWICKRFFNGQNTKFSQTADLLLLHSTYKNNKFLALDDMARIESMELASPYHYMVYGLGNWGVLGDLIYTRWEIKDLSKETNGFDLWRYGLDFGFTNDPTALVSTAYSKKDKTIYVFDEIYQRGLQNPDLARLAKPICKDGVVLCDSEAPKDIAELRCIDGGRSLNAYGVEKPKGAKLHTIQWLQQHKIVIDPKCINFINEISVYQWKKNKQGDSINEAIEVNDHLMDAFRYAYSKDVSSGDYFAWM